MLTPAQKDQARQRLVKAFRAAFRELHPSVNCSDTMIDTNLESIKILWNPDPLRTLDWYTEILTRTRDILFHKQEYGVNLSSKAHACLPCEDHGCYRCQPTKFRRATDSDYMMGAMAPNGHDSVIMDELEHYGVEIYG